MADIPLPPDIGRIRHLTAQMHKSEDDDGNPIPEGFIFAADGASGHTWLDPVTVGAGGTLVYNVQDYGAVGDGTTDDTTAIEDTFDAADATEGGIIYFPPTADYYKITSLITRTGTSKYHIVGGGTRYGPARVHQATSNTGAFKFAPVTGTDERLLAAVFENLAISGAGSASSGRGVEFQNDGHMLGCFVYGFYDGIFVGTSSFYSIIEHNTITDCDNSAITLSGSNNCTVDSNRLTGLFSPGGPPIGVLNHGILVISGAAHRIINNSIEYFTGYGVAVTGGGPITIESNYFETQQSTTGFAYVWLGNSTTTYNAWVVNNYFQGDGLSGFNAIKLDNAVGFHILANRFGVNSAIGIAHTGGSSAGFCWGNVNSPAGTFTLPSDTITSPGGFANPMTTAGDLIYGGASGAPTRRAIGSSGDVLTVSGGNPVWAAPAATPDALDDLTDVVLTSPVADETLRFDGSNWINDARRWEPVTFDPGTGPEIVFTSTDIVMTWETY